jgi:drug/metabolite transporter (DMT)-like permease
MQLVPVTSIASGWLVFGERVAGWALVGAALTLLGVSWGVVAASES